MSLRTALRLRFLAALGLAFACANVPATAPSREDSGGPPALVTGELRTGVGDRLSLQRNGRWQTTLTSLDRLQLEVDFLQIWLTRGWEDSWIREEQLRAVTDRGIIPVVTHYYFGDWISRERVEAQQAEWYASLERMADRIAIDAPVLVLLEPEFNVQPPTGETAVLRWPGWSEHLRSAAHRIRARAPHARVGVCVGDFAGTPYLEGVLGPIAGELDFIAFQEMRASTDRRASEPGYLEVGRSATELARYLKRAFDRPLLIGYVAVSSYDGPAETGERRMDGEAEQAAALRDLRAHREQLLEAGVFGWIYFQLFDDPAHEGYFGPAERDFGLITHDGRRKPAFEVFQSFSR